MSDDYARELAVHGVVRDAARGARVEVSPTGWDYYNASDEMMLHVDPPAWENTPWLCSGCDLCDGNLN